VLTLVIIALISIRLQRVFTTPIFHIIETMEFPEEYVFPNGKFTFQDVTHFAAHPEVTLAILEAGLAKITPPPTQEVILVDLTEEFGLWGKSSIVPLNHKANLFAFRAGRQAPSSVIDHPGYDAGILAIVTQPTSKEGEFLIVTAWCTDGENTSNHQPISMAINPHTKEGRLLREKRLQFWQYHAFALGVTPIEGDPFTSTWEEMIKQYGNIFHPIPKNIIL
jgi:hypothetical protein